MVEHFDVAVIGAGISGISAAWHLQHRCPNKSFVVLERRAGIGGTWDLFTYPGIRSDSDMFTLGFRFKPWTSAKGIADGPAIMAYLHETVAEFGIDRHIRLGHRVVLADWSDEHNRWFVTVEHDGQTSIISCSFAFATTGYYNYDEPYRPEFPGEADFQGAIVHPQNWPEELNYADKKIVVIGSGATAVTLLPALADSGAGHVTMLQRSPSYIGSLPSVDPIAARINKLLPAKLAYLINRWKAIGFQLFQYQLARTFPGYMRKTLMTMTKRYLPEGYDVETHFGPRYNPWDQRLCLAPDADLFKTIRRGQADVVTDTIDAFTAGGIRLSSGRELDADIIITATGLNLQLLGGAKVKRNGVPVDLYETMAYKGLMLSGMPNMAFTVGYTNASWTLKADLVSEFVCRLLNYMDAHGFDRVVPAEPADDVEERPLMDFTPGYVLRALHYLPKAGSRTPWRLKQNYLLDTRLIRHGKIADEGLHFTAHQVPASTTSASVSAQVARPASGQ